MSKTNTATLTPAAAFERVKCSAEQIQNDEQQAVGTMSPGDVVRQGDLYLVNLGKATDAELGGLDPSTERQLAPGNTQGSRHIAEGKVELFRAKNGAKVAEVVNRLVKKNANVPAELIGPVLKTNEAMTLAHPEHGNFVIPAGETCAVVYQRAYAEEVRRQQD